MEGENKETKIISVEKEKVKDPRRVEQGKKLAAKQQRETESFNPYMVIVPVVGIVCGGYYLLYLHRPNDKEDRREEPPEEPKKKSRLQKL